MMNISVAVCTYNYGRNLLPTLEALEIALHVASVEKVKAEILVVGNACTDNTREVIASFWKELPARFGRRYIEEPALGTARARRRAIEETNADLLIFCDHDVIPERASIQRIIHTADMESKLGGGSGVIHGDLLENAQWPVWLGEGLREFIAVREMYKGPVYTPPSNEPAYFPWTTFSWWRRDALIPWIKRIKKEQFQLGPCGKKMWRCDDTEIFLCAVDAGYQFKYDPLIEAWHRIPPHRLTKEYFRELLYHAEKSWQRLKNRRDRRAWRHALKFVARQLLNDPWDLIKRFALLGFPASVKIPFVDLSDSSIKTRLSDAKQRGGKDEILCKFLTPWRF